MDKATVSVLMLTYNHEKFVSKAIVSVLTQKTDFPVEIIIGEDFSKDSTRGICLEFERNNPGKIKLLPSNENLGMLPNFIRTLNECNGKYIAFCEGDDYWADPLKLQKQVGFLNDNSDYALIYTNKKVLVGDTLYDDCPDIMTYNNVTESLLISNKISILSVLARTEILKNSVQNVYNYAKERGWQMLDYQMWIYIAMHYKISLLNDDTVVYRLLPESASHSSEKEKAFLFHKHSLDVRKYFYNIYQKQSPEQAKRFYYRFNENIFHSHKRMILDYGFTAKSELLTLITTNPLVVFYIIGKKLKSIFQKSVSAN